MSAEGETGLAEVLHEAAQRVPQRALFIIISDLFIEPALLRGCLQHLRYRRHDVAVFHLLEQIELDFQFDRPVRFLDMEDGAPILADPSIIARQYRRSLAKYLDEVTEVIRDAAIDYHRVCIHEQYDDVLARFLLSRIPKRST